MTRHFAFPTITTERLVLRVPRTQDFERWYAFDANPQVKHFIGGTVPEPVSWRKMSETAGAWLLRGCAMMSVIERETGQWIGRVGPQHPEGWPGTEVGWGLMPEALGKGYATEAAAAAMCYAVDVLGWEEIVHLITPANLASIKVAGRLGSTNLRQVTLPPPIEPKPVDAWGQTKAEWAQNRKRFAEPEIVLG
jgi:RimJ/RimL family protein N-acetyltransferase